MSLKIIKEIDAHFEEIIMALLLIGISFIILLQIVMRLMGMSLPWPEELARYFYVWSVFLSLAFTIRTKTILRVDLLVSFLPRKVQAKTVIALQLINAVLYSTLAVYAVRVVHFVKISGQTSPALEFPMYLVYMVIPFGFTLTAYRSLQQIYFIYICYSDSNGSSEVQEYSTSDSHS